MKVWAKIFFVLTLFHFLSIQAFNYNDPCTTNSECDLSRFLQCINNRCLCEVNVAEYISNACRILANLPCEVGIAVQPCAPNSNCIGSTCVCDPDSIPNEGNRCFIPRGTDCSANPGACDPLEFLVCDKSEEKCDCDAEHATFDDISQTCQLLVSAPCSTESEPIQSCVDHAKCRVMGSIEAEFCSCVYPFVSNSKRTCSLPYDAVCDSANDLCLEESHLACGEDKVCICANPESTWYDPVLLICQIKANEPCTMGSSQKCVPNALCELNSDGLHSCACQGSYEPNSSGKCVLDLGYDEPCDQSDDQCDPNSFTYCASTSTCKCRNEGQTFYDADEKTCKLLAEATCEYTSQPCVNHAFCATAQVPPVCKCGPGLVMSIDRQCVIPYSEICDPSSDKCDKLNFQRCSSSGTCACASESDSIYDPVSQTCFLLHAADCNPVNSNTQQCAVNSNCSLETGKCTCLPLLEPNKRGLCALGFGKSCTSASDQCDKYKFLECGSNSHCTCQLSQHSWYDNDAEECRLRSGAACSTSPNAQSCVERSSCTPTAGPVPYKCQCNSGMSPTRNGRCFLEHGSRCDVITDYCDREDGFMQCRVGVNQCACLNDIMYYDGNKSACFLPLDAECSPILGGPACGGNAECSVNGRCACKSGYEVSGLNSCLKKYGTICEEDGVECNHVNFLECTGGVCGCPSGALPSTPDPLTESVRCYAGYEQACSLDYACSPPASMTCRRGFCKCDFPQDQQFFTNSSQCLSLVGARCHLNSTSDEPGLQCIENAECQIGIEVDSNFGICACKDGYTAQESKTVCENGSAGQLKLSFASKIAMSLFLVLGCK